jgi:hypothetical protein
MDYLKFKELRHHGIKGQKWGIRRYQNEDGTLTDAGRTRYNSKGEPLDIAQVTDQELNRINQRLNAEDQYYRMSGKQYKNVASKKDTYIKAGATAIGTMLATAIGGMTLAKIREKITGKPMSAEDIAKTRKKVMAFAVAGGAIGGIGSLARSFGGEIKDLSNFKNIEQIGK